MNGSQFIDSNTPNGPWCCCCVCWSTRPVYLLAIAVPDLTATWRAKKLTKISGRSLKVRTTRGLTLHYRPSPATASQTWAEVQHITVTEASSTTPEAVWGSACKGGRVGGPLGWGLSIIVCERIQQVSVGNIHIVSEWATPCNLLWNVKYLLELNVSVLVGWTCGKLAGQCENISCVGWFGCMHVLTLTHWQLEPPGQHWHLPDWDLGVTTQQVRAWRFCFSA